MTDAEKRRFLRESITEAAHTRTWRPGFALAAAGHRFGLEPTLFERPPAAESACVPPAIPGQCPQQARVSTEIDAPCCPWAMEHHSNPGRNTMLVEAQVTINGSQAAVWAAITDIENAAETISGIENIEVLERPANGLVGLRWRETRTLFGKPATAEKWITEAAENEFYKTRAEDGGFVFLTTKRISASSGGHMLTECHESRPQSVAAKLMAIPMGLFFKGVIRKALLQDLNDIKSAVEHE
jgi:hypothetical protein